MGARSSCTKGNAGERGRDDYINSCSAAGVASRSSCGSADDYWFLLTRSGRSRRDQQHGATCRSSSGAHNSGQTSRVHADRFY